MVSLLTKELLYDMDIKAVGDVLAIMNYANVSDSEGKESARLKSDKVCIVIY